MVEHVNRIADGVLWWGILHTMKCSCDCQRVWAGAGLEVQNPILCNFPEATQQLRSWMSEGNERSITVRRAPWQHTPTAGWGEYPVGILFYVRKNSNIWSTTRTLQWFRPASDASHGAFTHLFQLCVGHLCKQNNSFTCCRGWDFCPPPLPLYGMDLALAPWNPILFTEISFFPSPRPLTFKTRCLMGSGYRPGFETYLPAFKWLTLC